ncbi:hypothetical protein AA0121_g12380 [Alternaria tenuissima]|uniref:Uncharacterized protein n=1 Tax=Alternaria tenuissima TaxID=119927 RepID=A0A4Q4LYZ8_9PLEO|nr:hypothetical protein AA0114_g12425 [Alternaria tenuissima]RYO05798.1 hypothetical protein AA0121_g12380 [Alternaria tenuissima]
MNLLVLFAMFASIAYAQDGLCFIPDEGGPGECVPFRPVANRRCRDAPCTGQQNDCWVTGLNSARCS